MNDTKHSGRSGSWASLRDLEVLRAIIEQGGVTAAAKHLGVTQPAVSRALLQLERKSGQTFFVRSGGQLVPTLEGRLLYEASSSILDGFARLDDFRWLERQEERLSIVAAPTLARSYLPDVVAAFRRENPKVKVSIDIRTTMDVVTSVSFDSAEVGVAEVPLGDLGARKFPFRRSQLAVAMLDSHPLSDRPFIMADEILDQPMVALAKGNQLRTILDRTLWRQGRVPNIVVETSDAHAVLEFVRRDQGIAILNPFPLMLAPNLEIRFVPLRPVMEYETCLLTNESRTYSSTVHKFMRMVASMQARDTPLSWAVADPTV
jgi:DNA-binding transcriptional LysR family regulator